MEKILCPVCQESAVFGSSNGLPYRSPHPIFKSLKVAFCDSCKCGWVLNPPQEKKLQKYYQKEANHVFSFFGILEKPSMTLERLQSLARWHFLMAVLVQNPLNS